LDRRETDLKTKEIAVRDGEPEASPKSLDLLRQGDDLYSRGLYHQAIHVWTRILFLDRRNPEARLRIDRAKEVVSERERSLDVEIAGARELFDAGDIEAARERVRLVLAVDGSHGEAKLLAAAIEACDRRSAALSRDLSGERDPLAAEAASSARGVVIRVPKAPRPASHRAGRPTVSWAKVGAFFLVALLAFGVAAFYLSQNWEAIVSGGPFDRPSALPTPVLSDRLGASVPDLSQLRYYNAERLFAEGRYREALAELRRVPLRSKAAAEARSLILRIEDRLLREPTRPEPPTPSTPPDRG
jgi:tetratricopeptide (TPR) repeat protein